jgi:hypothetical protein
MKLYTEEQVRQAIKFARVQKSKDFKTWYVNEENDIINELRSIELPSDDDICDEAENIARVYFNNNRNHSEGLEEGAKRMAYWLIKNFKQQDNENRN